MYPLIEIKTVPIEIQMKVTRAHLEYARGTAQVEISRDKKGLSIRSQPIKVNIDSYESRNSVTPTTATVIQQQAQAGKQAAAVADPSAKSDKSETAEPAPVAPAVAAPETE